MEQGKAARRGVRVCATDCKNTHGEKKRIESVHDGYGEKAWTSERETCKRKKNQRRKE